MSELQVYLTADGSHSIISPQGLSYHSKHGAVQESRHVFVEAGLQHRATDASSLNILEIGFGTGLNALLTLQEALQKQWSIHFTTYELYPLEEDKVKELNYPELLKLNQEEKTAFYQMHTCAWEQPINIHPLFEFQKFQQSFHDIQSQSAFDIIYFDPFAPEAQADLWDLPLLKKMYQALRSQGVLTTYCAKGIVKRRLKSLGFQVEALPGPPGKREMTRAIKI